MNINNAFEADNSTLVSTIICISTTYFCDKSKGFRDNDTHLHLVESTNDECRTDCNSHLMFL